MRRDGEPVLGHERSEGVVCITVRVGYFDKLFNSQKYCEEVVRTILESRALGVLISISVHRSNG